MHSKHCYINTTWLIECVSSCILITFSLWWDRNFSNQLFENSILSLGITSISIKHQLLSLMKSVDNKILQDYYCKIHKVSDSLRSRKWTSFRRFPWSWSWSMASYLSHFFRIELIATCEDAFVNLNLVLAYSIRAIYKIKGYVFLCLQISNQWMLMKLNIIWCVQVLSMHVGEAQHYMRHGNIGHARKKALG